MTRKNILTYIAICLLFVPALFSCQPDLLDKSPLSSITPEEYLWTDEQLQSYTANRYLSLPSHTGPNARHFGTFGLDEHTDNMAFREYSMRFVPGQFLVGQSGGSWDFTAIYQCNYFLNTVVPRWQSGSLTGNADYIRHYIGEMYFFRAWEYFLKVQAVGDFPIIKTILPDREEALVAASKRSPRTEVVRLIISDLDSASTLLLNSSPDGAKNRLSKSCADLLKSRVALYEATWLKYFSGTAFVPNGNGWPGAEKDYNRGYQFPSGSLNNEIQWLLTEAMDAAKKVVDQNALVSNNGTFPQQLPATRNPYYDMFADVQLNQYSEVLLWRRYDAFGANIRNNAGFYATSGNFNIGLTRGYVESFLMENGLPIYAAGSGYAGDDYLASVRKNRDGRLQLFLKEPGQKNVLQQSDLVGKLTEEEIYPVMTSSIDAVAYFTGYTLRKGLNPLGVHAWEIGSIVFRSAEAHLNYLEACYEKNGSLDNTARDCWRQLRERARVSADFDKTIAATDVAREAPGDWGAYSAGKLIDPTLYNIRRERRSELLAEGLRMMDLKRWRSMDQLITTPYRIEGFKLWGPMQNWYKDSSGKLLITYGNASATVSPPGNSIYLRPYEKTGKELVYDGYRWNMAHYLDPIALQHFLITSIGKDVTASPIYQNPGWPVAANRPAL